jgi:hypothetical protein
MRLVFKRYTRPEPLQMALRSVKPTGQGGFEDAGPAKPGSAAQKARVRTQACAARILDCVTDLRCSPADWLACRVLLKIVYVLVRGLLSLAVLVFREDQAKDAELLALRHENAALRRHVGRVRYKPTDRAWSAALAG